MKIIIQLINLILNPKRLKAILSFHHKGYLESIGWFTAFDKKSAIDKLGNDLPWVTYSFIDFINSRLNKDLKLFEFGSGSSTIYYAKRVKEVFSVEHDKNWYEKMLKSLPENAQLIFSELENNGEYAKMAKKLATKFDVIIIDGRDRVNCCYHSLDCLSEVGVIVLDDSEREFYLDGKNYFLDNGFKELSFSGISPGLFYLKSTSVFYRSNNCLNI